MPDDILNSIASGINPDSQYKFQLDTQERMDSLSKPFDVPAYELPKFESVIPKEYTSGNLMYDKKIDLTKLIFSDDVKKQEMGWAALDQKAFNNPALKNDWADRTYEYNSAMERYKEHGYDISKSVALNEDRYHKLEWVDKGFMGKLDTTLSTWAVKMPILAVTKILSQANNLAVMAENVGQIGTGNFWSSVADNETVKWMEKQEQQLKEKFVPIYKSIDYDQKGFWSKLGDATFYNDTLVDAAAFMASAWATGGAVGSLGNLGRGTAIGRFFAAEAGEASIFGKSLQALTGSRTTAGVGAHILNTTSESALQAIGDYRKIKSDLLETVDPLTGNFYTEEESTKRAGQGASMSFNFNLGILSMSNALENKWIQKAFGNKGSSTAIRNEIELGADLVTPVAKPEVNKLFSRFGAKEGTKAAEFFTKNSIGKSINHYVPEVLKGVAMEGYWEENMQTATSRLADQKYGQGFYLRSGDEGVNIQDKINTTGNIFGDFLKQGLKQIKDATLGNDNEISESIGVGGLIAILGGGVMGKLAGYKTTEPETIKDKDGRNIPNPKAGQSKTRWGVGERQMKEDQLNDRVKGLKEAGENFLSVNDVFKKDGTIDNDKLLEKQAKISEITQRMGIADNISDPIIKEQIYKNLFAEYTYAHIKAGTEEQFLDKLVNYGKDGSKNADTLRMYGFTEDMSVNPQDYADIAKGFVELHEQIKDITYKPERKKDGTAFTASEYNMYESFLKSALYSYGTKNAINDIAINKIEENLVTNYSKLHNLRTEATNIQEQIKEITEAKDIDGTKRTNLDLLNETMKDLEDQYNRELESIGKTSGKNKNDVDKEFVDVTEAYIKALNHRDYLSAFTMIYSNPKTAMNFAHNQKEKQDAQTKLDEENETKEEVISNEAPIITKEEENKKKEEITKAEEQVKKDKEQYEEEHAKELEKNSKIADEEQKALSLKRIEAIQSLTTIEDLDAYFADLSEEEQAIHLALPLFKLKRKELVTAKKLADDLEAFNSRNKGNPPTPPTPPIPPTPPVPEQGQYDKQKDMKYLSSLVTATDSTYDFDNKGFIEIVRDDEYSMFQSEIMSFLTPETMSDAGYKLYIKKDTYNSKGLKTNEKGELLGKDVDGNDVIVTPTEVLVLMDGDTEVKVKDIFPTTYKSIEDKVITFQMDINSFNKSKNITITDRAEVLANKNAPIGGYLTRQDKQQAIDNIIKKYKEDQALLIEKRKSVADTGTPIQVNITFNSEGYQRFTPESSTVKSRFGNVLDISISASGEDNGSPLVTTDHPKLKGIKIPASLPLISKTPYFEEIVTAFTQKYKSFEDATKGIRFLDTFIYTGDINKFRIEENENKEFTINYLKQNAEDINVFDNKNEEITNGNIYMNLSRKALDEGYINSKGEDVSKNDYKEVIKDLFISNRKVILDKDGNEYDNPVNSYFHFDFIQKEEVPASTNTIEDNGKENEINKRRKEDLKSIEESLPITVEEAGEDTGLIGKYEYEYSLPSVSLTSEEENKVFYGTKEELTNIAIDKYDKEISDLTKEDIKPIVPEVVTTEVKQDNVEEKEDDDEIQIKKSIGGTTNKINMSTPLTAQVGGIDFTINRLTGEVNFEVPGMGNITFNLGIEPETSDLLQELYNKYPYDVNNKESSVYKKQIGEYTFYSLPYATIDTDGALIKNEFIVDQDGNNIPLNLEELELGSEYDSIIDEINKRNCK